MKAILTKLFAPQPHDDWAAVWMISISIVILLLWFASIGILLPLWQ
jgi:hypothetical protein